MEHKLFKGMMSINVHAGAPAPFTVEDSASVEIARAKFAGTGTSSYCVGRMSPERLAQQRAYDSERHKIHYQQNTEAIRIWGR